MAGCRLAALAPGLQLRRQHLCPYVVRAEDPRLHRRLSIVLKEGREELELDAVVSHGYSALIELLWHCGTRLHTSRRAPCPGDCRRQPCQRSQRHRCRRHQTPTESRQQLQQRAGLAPRAPILLRQRRGQVHLLAEAVMADRSGSGRQRECAPPGPRYLPGRRPCHRLFDLHVRRHV